jgi:serine protease
LAVPGLPTNPWPAHIINMSLGGALGPCTVKDFGYLIDAIAAARARGAVVVNAAGNDGKDYKVNVPAGCPGVISVAAHDRKGVIAYYSNFGDVTLIAPGGDIRDHLDTNGKVIPGSGLPEGVWSSVNVSLMPPNYEGVGAINGTSQAAPHVSGALALALARHPDWRRKPDLIEQKLRASLVPVTAKECPPEKPCGGRLDAERLVRMQ